MSHTGKIVPPNDLPKLSQPAHRALAEAGLTSLDEISRWREEDVLALHGMGPKVMRELREALHAKGLAFSSEHTGA
jgi:DNA-directed RNA polymerase alpha subunit